MEYEVEVSYSGGTFWTHYHKFYILEQARALCKSMRQVEPPNFRARIIKKEVIE